jgi:hypothetical protein
VIELRLSLGPNATAIWQELLDTRGFAAGYKSVKRFVGKLPCKEPPEACGVIETAPGEDLQVDYGHRLDGARPHNGKYRRVRLFGLTLGYSRKSGQLAGVPV